MYWYHIAGVCNYKVNWQYAEHLIDNPSDALNEARQYAKSIISKCKDIEYAVRGEGIDISSEVSDIQSSADDIMGLENKEVVESIDQFNQVSGLCKDQFHAGLEAYGKVSNLLYLLKDYQDTLPQELQNGVDDIINYVDDIDTGLEHVFSHAANLIHILDRAGWNSQAIDRVCSLFPADRRHDNKYLYCDHEEFQSEGNLRFRKEKDGVLLWCNGDQVGIEFGFQKVHMDSKGNVCVTSDWTKSKLASFEWKDLDTYFADAMCPTADEIALYGMVNSEAYNLSAINYCRGALEVF